MKKAVSKKKVWLIVGGVLLIVVLVALWWYGAFADLFDLFRSDKTYTPDTFYPEQITTDYFSGEEYEASLEQLEEDAKKMSAEDLTESVVAFTEDLVTISYYRDDLTYEEIEKDLPDAIRILSDELKTRHNAGRSLRKAYTELPVMKETEFGPIPDSMGLGHLELMLESPRFQKHMTFWEKNGLTDLAEEKQKEKAAEAAYPFAEDNYLLD